MTPGRFLLDRRAGKPDQDGNYTAAPVLDVGLEPCPTLTGAAFGRSVWTVTDTDPDAPLVVSTGAHTSAPRVAGVEGWRATAVPYERSILEPAPTVDSKAGGAWQVHPPGGRDTPLTRLRAELDGVDPADVVLRMGTHDGATVRRATEPAPTLVMGSRANAVDWFVGDRADEVEEAYRSRRPGRRDTPDE